MASMEQTERVISLLRQSRPADFFKKMNETAVGIGAVLMFLDQAQEAVSAGQISASMSVSTARMAVLLKKMEGKKLIVTGGCAEDARVTRVRLSEQGRAVMERMKAELYGQIGYLIDRVGMDRLIEFTEISGEIRAALEEAPGGERE